MKSLFLSAAMIVALATSLGSQGKSIQADILQEMMGRTVHIETFALKYKYTCPYQMGLDGLLLNYNPDCKPGAGKMSLSEWAEKQTFFL